MASLLEVQRAFANALTPGGSGDLQCSVRPAANLDVYRNNSNWQFRQALETSYPVLRRRAGAEYFQQLAHFYRQRFPSRSGDLHWVGSRFAEFLAAHLAGGEYAWLADLASLEWACELASVSEELPILGAESLAAVSPEDLEFLRFRFQPSLQLGRSEYPVVSIWMANQEDNAPPVDQSLGSECYMVRLRHQYRQVLLLEAPRFSFLSTLGRGHSLGEATTAAELDEPGLLDALRFMFAQGLVIGITPRSGS